MKICYVADARSPIAQNWIKYFIDRGDDVHVISSYAYDGDALVGAELKHISLGLSGLSRIRHDGTFGTLNKRSLLTRLLASLRSGALSPVAATAKAWFVPLDIYRHVSRVGRIIAHTDPDLVHAMRIPYEGILAASAVPDDIPLIISVWGNDFTLFASRYPLVGWRTRQAMRRADGLHPDCRRDLRLGRQWGFADAKPAIVLPGAGGIDTERFCYAVDQRQLRLELGIPEDATVVLNPRGFRSYVHNNVFFEAIPAVSAVCPDVLFLGLGMDGNPQAERWVRELRIEHVVRLLPRVEHHKVAQFFQVADISISLSSHDGTPNTLLEAMACGSFPVAGDIESVREWIVDGTNGILCNQQNVQSVVMSLIRAIHQIQLRRDAQRFNIELIKKRAAYSTVMSQAEAFYQEVLTATRHERIPKNEG